MSAARRRPLSDAHLYRDLTVAILALMAVGPAIADLIGQPKLDGFLKAAFLIFALYQITRRKTDLAVGLALGLPAVAGTVVDTATADSPAVNLVPLILGSLFLGFLVWRILADVLTGDRITSERVSGAIAAYLLIGILFSTVYGFIALADPGAFAVSDAMTARLAADTLPSNLSVFNYFSFVTMTTLGYGDITPLSAVARTFAWLQALLGQLYLAVMVAGLVGIHISRRNP